MEFLRQLIKNFWFILILTLGIGQEFTTGCMDDGYQQWSPNPGSPACNYDQLAIIEGDCLYNDCTGECGGSAVEDCAGECGVDALSGSLVIDLQILCDNTVEPKLPPIISM